MTMLRDTVTAYIATQTQMRVQSGPFKGMLLAEDRSWGDGDLAPKLLGTYEQELHPVIAEFSRKRYGAIVDIGCAEGYYAVGLAMLYPETPLYAFDSDPSAAAVLRRNMQLNGVSIEIGGECTSQRLVELASLHGSILLVCDCEGYEVRLVSDLLAQPEHHRALARSDLIIECHDFIQPTSTALCHAAFGRSHQVDIVYSGGRNPNAFPFLGNIGELDRWLAVCENRPCVMNWAICRSRSL